MHPPTWSLLAHDPRLSLGMAFAVTFRQAKLSFPLHGGYNMRLEQPGAYGEDLAEDTANLEGSRARKPTKSN